MEAADACWGLLFSASGMMEWARTLEVISTVFRQVGYLGQLWCSGSQTWCVLINRPGWEAAERLRGHQAFVDHGGLFLLLSSRMWNSRKDYRSSFNLWQQKSSLVHVWRLPASFFKSEKVWKGEAEACSLFWDDVTSRSRTDFSTRVHPTAPPSQSKQGAQFYQGNEMVQKQNLKTTTLKHVSYRHKSQNCPRSPCSQRVHDSAPTVWWPKRTRPSPPKTLLLLWDTPWRRQLKVRLFPQAVMKLVPLSNLFTAAGGLTSCVVFFPLPKVSWARAGKQTLLPGWWCPRSPVGGTLVICNFCQPWPPPLPCSLRLK